MERRLSLMLSVLMEKDDTKSGTSPWDHNPNVTELNYTRTAVTTVLRVIMEVLYCTTILLKKRKKKDEEEETDCPEYHYTNDK